MMSFAMFNSVWRVMTQYGSRLYVLPQAYAAVIVECRYWRNRIPPPTMVLMLLLCSPKVCQSQSATPPAVPEKAEVSKELTDGLLDLLVEPSANKEKAAPPPKKWSFAQKIWTWMVKI